MIFNQLQRVELWLYPLQFRWILYVRLPDHFIPFIINLEMSNRNDFHNKHPAAEELIAEDEQVFNPNWEEATIHGEASRVGFAAPESANNRCFCCLEQTNKQPVSLCENTKELQFLGFGFPLYYAFVRNCILILMVTICSYNIIALYKGGFETKYPCGKGKEQPHNAGGDSNAAAHNPAPGSPAPAQQAHPHSHLNIQSLNSYDSVYSERHFQVKKKKKNVYSSALQCTSWMVVVSSTQDVVTFDEKLLRVASFVIHLILLIYIRDKLEKLQEYFDERMTSPGDYSVLLNHLPDTPNIRAAIISKVVKEYKIASLADVILIPDLKQHEEMEQEKVKLIDKLREKVKKNIADEESKRLDSEIHKLEIKIRKHIIKQKDEYINDRLRSQKAIVILNTENDKIQLMQGFKKKKFEGQQWAGLTLVEAPEPKQIVWENLFVSNEKKRALTIVSWLSSFLVLALLTVTFALISIWKSTKVEHMMHDYRHEEAHDSALFYKSLLLVFGMIFIVVLLNKIVVSNLFHKFTDKERHANTFSFQFSFCLKYCLGLFFTTALMTLLVEAFLLKNYYKHDYGVVEEETIMFMINSLFVPLLWLINPSYLAYRYNKWKSYGQKYFTQAEANYIMERPSYDVGKRYGEVLEIMWFTFLYLSLIPIGGFFSCFGLAFYYWIDKYNLLRRSSIHSSVSGQLMNLTLKMLDFTLVLRVVGEFIFDFQIRDGIHLPSIVCFVIAVIYMLIPIVKIIKFFNEQKFNLEEKQYLVAQPHFTSTYYDNHVLFSLLKEDRMHLADEIAARNSKITARQILHQAAQKI